MKLELKHLAGYLPYGLKIQTSSKKYKETYTLLYLDLFGFGFKEGELFFKRCKPILHPLSDLTKEIEVNGIKFIPTNVINTDFFWDYVRNNMRDLVKDGSYILVGYLPALVVDKLLEWHFDIYGLIDKGLAIDINTLK